MYVNKKTERALASRQALIESARRLFEAKGYAATSTEELLAQTGLTRGALYHHFRDKKALFDAVCDAVHRELVLVIEEATREVTDPRDALRAGSHAWMRAVADPRRARLLLIEAPAVLGPDAWNSTDARHGYASLREGVQQAMGKSGRTPAALDAVAVALNGTMNELARWVAADASRLDEALAVVDAALAGFQAS
ncbi:MAG TPA: TetR/AcrR family transcriptional regulator [Burkholderiaceae bacterium]|nr:TetR/AcrR family transcriptional regulator [Burkholderiaceae bacterium]